MSRIPPHAIEVEADLLATMLASPRSAEIGLDALTSADFYVPAHARIFAAISRLTLAGRAVDPGLVAEELGRPASELRELAAQAPASLPTRHYASVIAEKAVLRRTLMLCDELARHAYDEQMDRIEELLADPFASLSPNVETADGPTEASVLAGEDHETDWVVEGLLGRHEVVMIVGEPGQGKSTWLRQFAVCVTSGLHPFRRSPIVPIRVLIVDAQESRAQASRAIRPLLQLAGDRYRGGLFVEPRPQGLDLTSPRHQRWLDALVVKCKADLVILGPLYNLIRGAAGRSKQSEETAELGMNALSDLMVRRNCSLIVEAHAPHGDEMRVRGSKLWEDFPDFGFGFVPDLGYQEGRAMDVKRFRGDRHSDRHWPSRFVQGHQGSWPWEASQAERRLEAV